MNEKKVLEIFEKQVSAKPDKIERCGVGHGNYVYIISDESTQYVIRCSNEENAYVNTIYWLKQLIKVNIPVPEIIAAGKYQNYNYIILSYLDGKDLGLVYPILSNDEKRSIAREVVKIQNIVGTIELKDIRDNWDWNTFIQYMLKRAKERIEKNGYFDINKVEQLWKMGGILQDYFHQIKPIAYLDDISTKNLLIDKGKVSEIIDVDYLLEEMDISRVERKAFIYYSLIYCVDFMGERGKQFGDKRIEVNERIISRLNQIYDNLIIEWNCLDL